MSVSCYLNLLYPGLSNGLESLIEVGRFCNSRSDHWTALCIMCFQYTHKTVLFQTFHLVEVGITQQFCRNDETSHFSEIVHKLSTNFLKTTPKNPPFQPQSATLWQDPTNIIFSTPLLDITVKSPRNPVSHSQNIRENLLSFHCSVTANPDTTAYEKSP